MISQRINQLFRAFADENRLRILSLLAKGEICVCDIMKILKMPQPKVSRHLAYLRRAKLVDSRRDGLWIYYSLTKPAESLHKKLLNCLDCCSEEAPVFSRDKQAWKALPKRARCC